MGRTKSHNFESSNEILLIERFKHSSRIFHRRNVISLNAIKYYKIIVLLPKHTQCRANYNSFKVSVIDWSIFLVFILRYYLAGIEFFLERLWQKINYVTATSHHGNCYLTLKWTISNTLIFSTIADTQYLLHVVFQRIFVILKISLWNISYTIFHFISFLG